MNTDGVFLRIKQLIESKNTFSICLPQNPTLDGVAAATALYLSLSKLGKNTSLGCSADLSTQYDLIAVDKFQNNLASHGDNLVIAFPYTEGSIDKVTYNIEDNHFNLLIQPKEGYERLDPSQVSYRYTGGKVDAIFIIDAPTLETLGDLYLQHDDNFKGVDIINIDRHLTNSNFGTINVVEKQTSSLSELMYQLLTNTKVEIDVDIASNLFAGIVAATNNFTAYSVSATTFETSALLLKKGAVKKPLTKARVQAPFQSPLMNNFAQPPAAAPKPPIRQQQPFVRSAPQASVEMPSVDFPFEESAAIGEETIEAKEPKQAEKAPKEWLRPKIFKGGSGGMV